MDTVPLRATRRGASSTTPDGQFAPALPTNGRELIAAWELPPDAWESETVKVARYFAGTNRVELVQSIPLQVWDMEDTAAQFGPGRYRLTPGPGPHGRKQCEMTISEEYARAAGWATAPPQPPSYRDLQARRTFEAAARGPVDPVDLAAMIETAVSRAVAQQQPKTDDKMDALALVLRGFDLAGTLQAKALETAQKMAGITPTAAAAAEKEPATMADVLLQLGPSLLDTINNAMKATPQQVHAAPQPQPRPTIAAPPTTQPQEAPKMPQNFPTLTEEEKAAIAPAVGLLAPHGAQLAQAMKAPVPASMIAGQLLGYIGPDMEAPILALSACVESHGPAILAAIHRDLGTQKAADVIQALRAELEQAAQE